MDASKNLGKANKLNTADEIVISFPNEFATSLTPTQKLSNNDQGATVPGKSTRRKGGGLFGNIVKCAVGGIIVAH